MKEGRVGEDTLPVFGNEKKMEATGISSSRVATVPKLISNQREIKHVEENQFEVRGIVVGKKILNGRKKRVWTNNFHSSVRYSLQRMSLNTLKD